MKRCPGCGETKPLADFVRNRATRSGRGAYCRPCHSRICKANLEKRHRTGRNFQLKRRYGVDETEVAWMALRQGDVCAVCGDGEAVHVDHDHESGAVRGVLCFNCNRGLGYLGDDLAGMYGLADHLETALI